MVLVTEIDSLPYVLWFLLVTPHQIRLRGLATSCGLASEEKLLVVGFEEWRGG